MGFRIAYIGIEEPAVQATVIPVRLLSDETLSAFDFIYWDLVSLDVDMARAFEGRNSSTLWSEADWRTAERILERRLKQLLDVVCAGSRLVIVARRTMPGFKLSSRGENRESLARLPILSYWLTDKNAGEIVDYCGPAASQAHASRLAPRLRHDVIFTHPDLTPLFISPSKVEGETKIAAGYVFPDKSKGAIIFTGPPKNEWADSPKVRGELIVDWVGIAKAIQPAVKKTAIPGWAYDYRLPKEQLQLEAIDKAERDIKALNEETERLKDDIAKDTWTKFLFAGDDDALEKAIVQALQSLGFDAIQGPQNRADILAKFGDTILVAEAKGHSGAVKDWAINQCERYCNEVKSALTVPVEQADPILGQYREILAKLGVVAPIGEDEELKLTIKGAVIGNAYKDTPLDNRPADSFSAPLQRQLTEKSFAGLTGLQLLSMYVACADDPKKVETTRALLLGSKGVITDFDDWKAYLVKKA